jgi:hypothetical protein
MTNQENKNKINEAISIINSGRTPTDRQVLLDMCVAILKSLDVDTSLLASLAGNNIFTGNNTFTNPITGDIIGDVYQNDGVTKAVENNSTPVVSNAQDPSTPIIYGRQATSAYRYGATVAAAGSALAAAIASLQGMWGSLGVQSWNVNNTSLMDNLFLNGFPGDYIYTRNGAAVLLHFVNGGLNISTAPSGTAGAAASLESNMEISSTGVKLYKKIDNIDVIKGTDSCSPAGSVTLNKQAGSIDCNVFTLSAGMEMDFTINNSYCKSDSIIMVSIASLGVLTTADAPVFIRSKDILTGSFKISFRNNATTNSISFQNPIINFLIV